MLGDLSQNVGEFRGRRLRLTDSQTQQIRAQEHAQREDAHLCFSVR